MKKLNINQLIFYLSYSLFLFCYTFNNVTFLQRYISYIDLFSLFLLFISILLKSKTYERKAFITIVLIGGILLISSFFSKDLMLVRIFLFIIAMKEMNFKKVIRYDFYVRIIFTIIVLLLYKLGLTNTLEFYRDGVIRNTLGFIHPNTFSVMVYTIVMEYIFIYVSKFKLRTFLLLLLAFIFIDKVSDSRTGELSLIVFMIMVLLDNVSTKTKKVAFKITKYVPLIMILISFIMIYLYKNNVVQIQKLNLILSGRIHYGQAFLDTYGIKLFGQEVKMFELIYSSINNLSSWVLDNSYLLLLIRYGLLCTIIFYKAIVDSIKVIKNEYSNSYLIYIVLTYLIMGAFETSLIKLQYNPFILILGYIIYSNRVGDLYEK